MARLPISLLIDDPAPIINPLYRQSMETKEAGEGYARGLADKFITEDGAEGQLAALLRARTPIVFHTHWQSLHSNGRCTGMRGLEIVFERVAKCWADQVEWIECSTLAAWICAGPA